MAGTALNEEQRQAVHHQGHLLLLACPGSGKTLVLANRAAALLDGGQGNLVAVTFTREGANELTARIHLKSPKNSKRIYAGTFHSLCIQQLRRSGIHPRILDEGGRRIFMIRALEYTEEDIDLEDALKLLDETKSTLTHQSYSGIGSKALLKYQQMIEADGFMDFGDLIINAVHGMQTGTVAPLSLRWLLADESQDMDEAQYAWMRLHHELAGAEITLVGDDDQSIFGFRHALGHMGMMRFAKDFGARTMVISRNYRCAPEILAPAARMISNNENRALKSIIAAKNTHGIVRVLRPMDREEEAATIAEIIAADPSGWAILSRTNRLLDELELSLAAAGVEYTRMGGTGFWDRFEAQAVRSILAGILEGGKHILQAGVHQRHGKPPETKTPYQLPLSIWHGVDRALSLSGLPHDAIRSLQGILSISPITEWPGLLKKEKDAIANAMPDSKPIIKHAIAFLEEYPGMCSIALRDADLLIHVVKNWTDTLLPRIADPCGWALSALSRMKGSLAQRIANTARKQNKKKEGAHGVILGTLHASKGLEWPRVAIIGAEEGICPHLDGEMEEERRLFYVGMTRAKNELLLSSVREGEVSRFLLEAGLNVDEEFSVD